MTKPSKYHLAYRCLSPLDPLNTRKIWMSQNLDNLRQVRSCITKLKTLDDGKCTYRLYRYNAQLIEDREQ